MKTKRGHVKWSSYVPSPTACIQKDICTWVWPMSAHTDVCVDKHKRDVHALPVFRRWAGDMCKDALVYSAFRQLLLLMHAPPKKAKQPSLDVTKMAQFTMKGVSGTTYVPLSDGSFPFLSFWFSSPTSDKPCFNLTNKIKISSRTEHLRVSQEKVFVHGIWKEGGGDPGEGGKNLEKESASLSSFRKIQLHPPKYSLVHY